MFATVATPHRTALRCSHSSWSGVRNVRVAARTPARVFRVSNGTKVSAWFKFGKAGFGSEDAGIVGSQGRDDFDKDDVEQYFNYMGLLAVEGSYDTMEELMATGAHPADVLLLMAATEGDAPKIEELLKAGANPKVQDQNGQTAIDRAKNDKVRALLTEA